MVQGCEVRLLLERLCKVGGIPICSAAERGDAAMLVGLRGVKRIM